MSTPAYQIFLNRVRRHWTVRRVFEHAAIGLLIGCGVAVLLITILLYRGQDARLLAIVFPMAGVTIGVIAGSHARPTLLATASVADERFGTADLLTTALSMCNVNDVSNANTWTQTITALANDCCDGRSPAELLPRRLPPRVWAAVAMSVACVITLAILCNTGASTQAHSERSSAGSSVVSAQNWAQALQEMPRRVSLPPVSPQVRAEESLDSLDMRNDDSSQRSSSPSASTTGDAADRTKEGLDDGTGQGSARTGMSRQQTANPRLTAVAAPSDGTRTAEGDGTATHDAAVRATNSRGHLNSAGFALAVAPWNSSTWPADRAAAMEAVRARKLPGRYRELVGDYFERK